MLVALTAPAPAPSPSASPPPERWSFHAQSTNTQQYHGAFPAAYSGAQSLSPRADTQKTFDATLFLGARLWTGGEGYVNPELDQGFGLNDTFGVAAFPSGEAYKVGAASPYGRLQRYFLRQTFELGGERQAVDPDANQLGGAVSARHLTLTFGKFSVVDVFDNNTYAHDPRNDFLNWAVVDMGAFDYAADAWGYTRGLSAELAGDRSTLRAGIFQLSSSPNETGIESRFLRQYSPVLELERRTSLFGGRPGKIRALAYGDYGYMGILADATSAALAADGMPDIAAFRTAKHWKLGGGLNLEQEIAPHVGVFGRLSAQNGTYETYDFSEIDRSISGGFSVDGGLFRRPADTFGIAVEQSGLSVPHRRYLAAGGLGILIGDGALSYGDERVVESYYRWSVKKGISLTGDCQYIANPGYNLVRGPVSVYTLRLHGEI